VVFEDIVGWWYLTWADNYGVDAIVDERAKGKAAFWQMMMLDIGVAKTQGLTYYLYDHKDIGFDMATVGGADPTSVDPDFEVGGQKRSSFALCYLSKLPKGGAVIKDGVLKPMGIKQAKEAILQAQTMFKNWETTGVEGVGAGRMFQQYLRMDNRVRFLDSNIKTPDKKGVLDKKTRFEYECSPHLESGLVRVSDENTPFLNAVRDALDNFFDLDQRRPDERLDALDSLYHAMKLIPETLRTPDNTDISPLGLNRKGGLWHPVFGKQPEGTYYG
jgi:hypothetical protein